MIYTIEITVNEFQNRVLKRRAAIQSISPQTYLEGIVGDRVLGRLNEIVDDALKTKLSKMDAGLALAQLDAMDG